MSMQITGSVIAANAALGSLIGQISVVPPHSGLTTFELLVNPSGYFMLSASGGLYVRWMSPAVVGNYVIRVYAHGSGWLEFSSFTIRIVPAPTVATPSKVTLNPSTVSVPDNSAAGTQLSSATVAMSDGSVFSGTLIADNALVAVNGKLLTLSRGLVAADVGLVNVTVIAKQNNVSVTAVLPLTITAHAPPPLPTPTKVVLTPPTISIPDNSLTGTALSTAAVTMSDGSGFTGVLAASDPLVGISGMALKSSRSLTSSDDGVRNVVVTATQNGSSATATLGLTITAVVTPPGISPDGSTISGGIGSLVTVDGTWTFGAAAPGRPGEWLILLNGAQAAGGVAGTLEVNKGGKLYAFSVAGHGWFLWQSGAFVPSSDPSPPLPTPTKVVLNPQAISVLPDNSPAGMGLSVAAITMSDASSFTGVLTSSDPLVAISGMNLSLSRGLTPSDDGVRNVVVTATQNGGSATATLGLTITAVVTPPGLSPDGSTISGGTGSLVTTDGTWTFGAAATGRPGEWSILLSSKPSSVGIAGTLEVNKGGKLYALTIQGSSWFLWQSGAFVPSSDPSPPAPTLNTILNPSSASLQDNTPAGTTLSTASVTMSDGSNPPPLHLTVSDPIVSVSGMTLKTSRGLTPADDGLRDVSVTAVPN